VGEEFKQNYFQHEDSCLRGCYTVSTVKNVPMFRKLLVPSSSGSDSPRRDGCCTPSIAYSVAMIQLSVYTNQPPSCKCMWQVMCVISVISDV